MTSTINATATATATTGLHRWNSPIPYLFGGLALMIGLIALALVILACSHKKPTSTSTSTSSNGAEENPTRAAHVVEMEPRIVVIMAGDDHPMYLAKPVASTIHGDQQV